MEEAQGRVQADADEITVDPTDIVRTIQRLSMTQTVEEIQEVVRRAARRLTHADGATFVLRDGDRCFYVDEDAIGPLWKGLRFPMTSCISGWAMLNAQPVSIPDIYVDERIPLDAYRPTFVKSLAMVPIRTMSPIGAIGVYWATEHTVSDDELAVLQALADSTAVAMENAAIRADLEQRVAERTAQLAERNESVETLYAEVTAQAGELQKAAQDQERLLHHLAHEVRGPLYAGDGLLELVIAERDRDEDDALRQDLRSVRATIAEALRVVDDQLEAARLSAGQLRPPRRAPIDLRALVTDLLDGFRAMVGPGVELRHEIDDDAISLSTDRHFVGQILRNLLTNAAKFTDSGEIVVRAEPEGPGFVRLTVRDTGIGIPPQALERIFEEFAQIEDAQASRRAGTGLGLPLARRLTAALGGSIAATSSVGEGATFTVLVPTT